MKKRSVCTLLGIEYPIIQASMAYMAAAELVAAVSRAGGMGTIGPNAGAKEITYDVGETGEMLREQIRKVKSLTDKPFAVNFAIGLGADRKFSDRCVEVGIEEGVKVAVVSQGSAKVYTEKLKKAGMKVFHVVATAEHARKAEQAGVDAVIAVGSEGGGHGGFDALSTFTLAPQVADAVKIPMIIGGGIVDARGLMAALALGAEGVYMGTRFIATHECDCHPNYKQAVIEAGDVSTVLIGHGAGRRVSLGLRTEVVRKHTETESPFPEERRGLVRVIMNEFCRQCFELEAKGATIDEVQAFINSPAPGPGNRNRYMAAAVYGDIINGCVGAGQQAGMIKEMLSAEEVVRSIVEGVS